MTSGPSGAPRLSVRLAITPSRASRPRPPATVVRATAPAVSSIPTVPILSDHDRAEPVGTPLLRLPPSTDAPLVTTIDLDALDAPDAFQFGDSAGLYSHADWAGKQQAEPACSAAMRYIALGRPKVLPANCLWCFPSTSALPSRRFRSWLTKATCTLPMPASFYSSDSRTPRTQRSVDRTACLLNDEPIPICVPLLKHP